MKHQIVDRLNALRALMKAQGIDAVIIPQTDPHQSEYIADHWQVRRFLSGFTGSAGSLVVTSDAALLWTDSRYFIQAADQLAGTPVRLMKDGLPSTPSISSYLIDNLPQDATIGIDGMLFSATASESLDHEFTTNGLRLVTDFDVVDQVWTDRPSLPKDLVFVHDVKYAGRSAVDKLAAILADAKAQGAGSAFISALDEIAWALNIRCRDVKYNPVATAYLYVGPDETVLLIDLDKIDGATAAYLRDNNVVLKPYTDVKGFISSLPADRKVLIEGGRTSVTLRTLLGDRVVLGSSPIAVPKALKNETEIAGFRAAMVRDGIAMVKAFMEMERMIANGESLTELGVDRLLLKYRSEQPLFFDESFGTIAGYADHGAIVHYEPTEESDVEIRPEGLLLIDSGAQYLDGTTDITRTIAMGEPTEQEKHDFTLVMKGHIALDSMVFPVGTLGVQIDAEARKFLWREGLGYLHGTGHGVGSFLNVHEGPQTIRMNPTPVPIMEGMVTSNEPGLYREGVHGVRCENLVLCVKAMSTDFGDFLRFEPLTLFPFDTALMQTEIMTDDEIDWVNSYHAKVYESLAPGLTDPERDWLASKTVPINK